jgi:hypothetical protein
MSNQSDGSQGKKVSIRDRLNVAEIILNEIGNAVATLIETFGFHKTVNLLTS